MTWSRLMPEAASRSTSAKRPLNSWRVHPPQQLRDAVAELAFGSLLDAEVAEDLVAADGLAARRRPGDDEQRIEECLGAQHLDGHVAEELGIGLVVRKRLAGALVGLAVAQAANQVLDVESGGPNSSARSCSSSGCEAGWSSRKSSTGLTKPRPKKWPQTRLTKAGAKNGLSADVAQAAKRGRNGWSSRTGCSPPRKRALTTWPPLACRCWDHDAAIGWLLGKPTWSLLPACGWVLRTSVRVGGPPLLPPLRTRPKKAAVPQKSACFQLANGWLWHSAHCSCTPRKSRVAEAASRLGCGWPFSRWP